MYRTIHWMSVFFEWRYNRSVSVSTHQESPWSSAGFLQNHKSISLLNLFRCYSSHLSVYSMCSSRLLPHSECITPKTFIPRQTVHLYTQIHFTDSLLSPLSYLHSLHCSSAEDGKQAAGRPAARNYSSVPVGKNQNTQDHGEGMLSSETTSGAHQHPHCVRLVVRLILQWATGLFPTWWIVWKVSYKLCFWTTSLLSARRFVASSLTESY